MLGGRPGGALPALLTLAVWAAPLAVFLTRHMQRSRRHDPADRFAPQLASLGYDFGKTSRPG
jgi:hypothetical protein